MVQRGFIERFKSGLPGDRVLNLGGGRGCDALLLRDQGLRLTGLDRSRAMVETTRSLGLGGLQATFDKIDFPAASFDGVSGVHVADASTDR